MVAPERIELSLPRGKHDFESSASTNSATEPFQNEVELEGSIACKDIQAEGCC